MGHACVVAKDRVWVLGGMDAAGKTLQEVWSWDGLGEWKRHPDAGWRPRCMPAVTNFPDKILANEKTVLKDRIWVYGGATEPFGDTLRDMWTSRDGDTWERWEPDKNIPQDGAEPLGCALQVLNGELHLLGTFRKGTEAKARQLILDRGQRTWSSDEIAHTKSWHRQKANTFSLLSVEYKGLIFVRSLNYETADNPADLTRFVP